MSSRNGDKSRFHRMRKQKIARRERNRTFQAALHNQPTGPTAKKTAQ